MSTAAIMAPLNVILAVKPLKNILSENLQPVFLRLLPSRLQQVTNNKIETGFITSTAIIEYKRD